MGLFLLLLVNYCELCDVQWILLMSAGLKGRVFFPLNKLWAWCRSEQPSFMATWFVRCTPFPLQYIKSGNFSKAYVS